jgi:hypothetical protein
VNSDGGDANRVLIVGAGLAVGWGATSHVDALPGSLARALSDLTDVGTDVDVVADPWMLLSDTARTLADSKLWRYDLVVLTLGVNEALSLESPRRWRKDLRSTLASLRSAAAPSARFVVVGIEPVGSLAVLDGPNADRANVAAAALDAASLELCASIPGVTFISLTSGSDNYGATAEELADSVLDDIFASRAEAGSAVRGAAGQAAEERERERQAAVDGVNIIDTPAEDRFDRIVTMARQLYGTSGAAFAIVDRDRVWHKSKSEGVPVEVPKSQSFCSTTIQLRGPHVVPDMLVEAAPDDTTAAAEVGVRFYAGYPVEAPNGEQIGALCIFDEKPRTGEVFDETMLRQLALLIQVELQVESITT